MVIKRRDFQKAASFIHEFLLKLNEDAECAELRDSLNLALLHMQKYYRRLQNRSYEKNAQHLSLSLTARGLSPMTPFVDAPDKFQWKWINLDNARLMANMTLEESVNFTALPPIIQAAKQGNTELIVELVNSDPASADDADGIGRTALTYAVHFGQIEALHCLLEHQADANVQSHDGSTAMHQACHDANHIGLKLLLQYGGDFTLQDTHGRAPIHWAVTTSSLDCLKLLVSHHADVNVRDKDGLSPSMWACRLDHIKHFEYLGRSDTFRVEDRDGIERDEGGRTWMHWAVRRTEPLECLQTLLTTETAAIKDDEGKTVLLSAAEMGSLPACRIALEIGGMECTQDRDNQDRTALHLATNGGHGDVVNFLLEHGGDITMVDKYKATAWDYAKNRQLHYCQLIFMSHHRQRLQSNPTSPMPNGLGFSFSSMNGDIYADSDYDRMSTRNSIDMPITPPHPPKRPRTSRILTRRAQSLTNPERDRAAEAQAENRQISSAGAADAEMLPRRKERIEVETNEIVSVNTRRASSEAYRSADRLEMGMSIDSQHEGYDVGEDDVEGVSVGGMDVSDIEDDDQDEPMPKTSRGPPPGRSPYRRPHPPPRFPPRPPQTSTYAQPHAQPLEAQYRPPQHAFEAPDDYDTIPSHVPQPKYRPSPNNQRVTSGMFNNRRPPLPAESFPPPGPRPAPAPRSHAQPIKKPVRPPPPMHRDPSPPNRPGSGREQIHSPPLSSQSSDLPSAREKRDRPGSGSQPPGVLEGKRIAPPTMLMPLENAPKLPPAGSFDKVDRKKKKKKKEREKDKDKDKDKDRDSMKSPPQDITPPRGFAAPLHPPPSATTRQQRAQSGIPPGIPQPRLSKGPPQRHEPRYIEENMEDEKEGAKPPMVNGYAVPVREAPIRSANPGQRLQPMENEEYGSYDPGQSDGFMQDSIDEEEEIGPLIPPPQGFRGSTAQPNQMRPVSQSMPQDSRTARMAPTSGKPPIPRARTSSTSSVPGRQYGKGISPRRTPRPPTDRSDVV